MNRVIIWTWTPSTHFQEHWGNLRAASWSWVMTKTFWIRSVARCGYATIRSWRGSWGRVVMRRMGLWSSIRCRLGLNKLGWSTLEWERKRIRVVSFCMQINERLCIFKVIKLAKCLLPGCNIFNPELREQIWLEPHNPLTVIYWDRGSEWPNGRSPSL